MTGNVWFKKCSPYALITTSGSVADKGEQFGEDDATTSGFLEDAKGRVFFGF